MRQVAPIVRRFRHQLKAFLYIPKITYLQQRLVYLVEKLECLLDCDGEKTTRTATVTDEVTLLRYPDLFAVKTTIYNSGANPAFIHENDIIVAVIPAGKAKNITLCNRYIVDAVCATGLSTTLTITTHRRCACGDDDPQPYGVDVVPIGGDLI